MMWPPTTYVFVGATAPVRASARTDTSGAFSLTLPDGRYVIRATNVGGYASTASESVVVSDNPVHITLIVDSGIR